MAVINDAEAELITHSLGSCLGVTVYDPYSRVGGMLHVMLPDSSIDRVKAVSNPCMFVDTGVPRLFRAAYGLGGQKTRLIVKVAGGAQFLDEKRIFNIGERNFKALELLLARNGVTSYATDVGGRGSRTLRLRLSDGRVTIQAPAEKPYEL